MNTFKNWILIVICLSLPTFFSCVSIHNDYPGRPPKRIYKFSPPPPVTNKEIHHPDQQHNSGPVVKNGHDHNKKGKTENCKKNPNTKKSDYNSTKHPDQKSTQKKKNNKKSKHPDGL